MPNKDMENIPINDPYNAYYPTSDSLGIDSNVAQRLRSLILDNAIEIPGSDKMNTQFQTEWCRQSLIEYGAWLCTLLEITPNNGQSIKQDYINRASKLRLGPGDTVFQNHMDGIGDLQIELGFNSHSRYKKWTRNDYLLRGQELAVEIGHRPSKKDIALANNDHTFPSLYQVTSFFGTMQNFYELIGYPNVRNWGIDDYVDWGIAFKKQNGHDSKINGNTLTYFSKKGRGPSKRSILVHLGGVNKYNDLVENEYRAITDTETTEKKQRQNQLMQRVIENEELAAFILPIDENDRLKIAAHYSLIENCAPDIPHSLRCRIANSTNSDSVAKQLVENNPELTMAHIETTAIQIGIFDDLWSMYRFQNVELMQT